jgi:MFS family permease
MREAGHALLWAVAGFGAATIVFGLSRSFPLSLAMLALAGALDMISVVIRATLVQVRTPDEMRGRVSAVNGVFIDTSNELGGFESGATAALFGPIVSVVGGGVITMLVVAAIAYIWPELRRMGPLHTPVPAPEPEPLAESVTGDSSSGCSSPLPRSGSRRGSSPASPPPAAGPRCSQSPSCSGSSTRSSVRC